MRIVYAALLTVSFLAAQASNPNQTVTLENQPIYRVTVVSRTAQAVSYRHRSGATKIDFAGTALLPKAKGSAKVESKAGYIEIEVEFKDLVNAQKFGPEYLTYVLWAITPEGRAKNLGEILLDSSGKGKLNVSTEFQSFGMIVTAEPYFAVRTPSDVVVMENILRGDTLGKSEIIDAKFELLKRGSYNFQPSQSSIANVSATNMKNSPIYLWEARNALDIARFAQADKYATDTYKKAQDTLAKAEDYKKRKQDKPASMTAREAVQIAEDARQISVQRVEEERLATERRLAAEKQAAEEKRRAEAEEAQRLEAARRAQAEQFAREEADRRAKAEASRLMAEAAQKSAEAAQKAAEGERLAAEKAKAEADAARAAALEQQKLLAQQASEAEKARLAAEQDKEKLRQQLLQQLSMILETRDTARGLIVNMSDVLFDTAQYTLRPIAREKLARVSGIILSHPGLKIEVEGHTDSVGSDAYNQKLSEQRAASVRDYLVSQGLSMDILTARGFGKTAPVASNDTAAGRQQNRRVELVVSGEVIGTKISTIYSNPATPTTPAPQP